MVRRANKNKHGQTGIYDAIFQNKTVRVDCLLDIVEATKKENKNQIIINIATWNKSVTTTARQNKTVKMIEQEVAIHKNIRAKDIAII